MQSVEKPDVARSMERQHLNRLGLVCGLGVLFSVIPFLIQAQFAVWLAILTGIFALLGLSRLIEIFTLGSD